MEIKTDSPEAWIEVFSKMSVIRFALHRTLPGIDVPHGGEAEVGLFLVFSQCRVSFHKAVQHPPVLSAASSHHRDFLMLLDDDVAIFVYGESPLSFQ